MDGHTKYTGLHTSAGLRASEEMRLTEAGSGNLVPDNMSLVIVMPQDVRTGLVSPKQLPFSVVGMADQQGIHGLHRTRHLPESYWISLFRSGPSGFPSS